LQPINFTCDDEQRLPDGNCTITTGYEVLDLYNLNVDPAPMMAALGACAVIYRLVAFALLKAKKTKWGDWWRERRGKNI